jgi:hypothetical protein
MTLEQFEMDMIGGNMRKNYGVNADEVRVAMNEQIRGEAKAVRGKSSGAYRLYNKLRDIFSN